MEVGSPLLEDQGSGVPWPGPSKNRTTNHYSSFVEIGRNSGQSVNETINYHNSICTLKGLVTLDIMYTSRQ